MCLAPYGEPRYKQLILDHLVGFQPDGTFRRDMRYCNYCTGLTMTNRRFEALLGQPVRQPEQPLTQFHMNVAASIQSTLDEIMLRLTRSPRKEFGLKNLCLAGGVALNCVANGKIASDGEFEGLWIQPASGDAPFQEQRAPCLPGDRMRGSYLGPEYSQAEIEQRLQAAGAVFEVLPEEALLDTCADAWSPRMQSTLNLNYSTRIQTVNYETNPMRHALLTRFREKTGSPVLVNTSFNVRGEPIVCTPEDAFRCFMGCEIEALAAGRCFLLKEQQNPALRQSYTDAFALD